VTTTPPGMTHTGMLNTFTGNHELSHQSMYDG